MKQLAEFNFTKSFCIFATKRSGHHAVLNWIAMNMTENSIHINDINPDDLLLHNKVNPQGECSTVVYADSLKCKKCERIVAPDHNMIQLKKQYGSGTVELISSIKQEIINFENVSLEKSADILSVDYFKNKEIKSIGVLRDYYNNLASTLYGIEVADFQRDSCKYFQQLTNMKTCWLSIANEYVKNPNNVILFNFWNLDSDYRKSICENFNLNNFDYGFDKNSTFGGGSSFTDHRKNLHKRYEIIKKMPIFEHFAKDAEIIELNKKIFNLEIF
tara:strand:- start:11741 stop:12559 length:819 start_codon:yes stop_codon:yes gene_type:complete